MTNQFTPREDAKLAQLRGRELTWYQIGNRLGRNPDICRRRYKKLNLQDVLLDALRLYDRDELSYDMLIEEWNDWLGRTVTKANRADKPDKNKRRIGIVCDTHCPYQSSEVLAELRADGPYDLIIHGGDLLDWYAVSSFVRRKHVDPKLEIQRGTWVLELLSDMATEVEVVSDNHGKRLLKAISKANLPTGLMELLQWFAPELDLFKLMTEDLPNVSIADPVEVVEGVHFFGQYGDLIVGHADTASKLKLRAAENLDAWLREWKEPLGLSPWRVVAQAHTHATGMAYGEGGAKIYMELGACCTLGAVSYALQGKMGYRAPVPTYTILEQDRTEEGWKTDFHSIRQIVV